MAGRGKPSQAACYNFLTFFGGLNAQDRDRLLRGLTLRQPGREPGGGTAQGV